ncbi:MAG: DUF58 domain-containing protein [Treponema sp.]|jgi:hypothetical protein|nr:DUF58 domain-containing protein [Treponema sp.]
MIPPRFQPFFTPAGLALILLGPGLLIRSLAGRNAYEIILGAAILGCCLVLGLSGAWGARRLAALEPGWKPPLPLTANAAAEMAVTGLDWPVPWFFRIHFVVKGRFFPSGSRPGCWVYAETSASRGAATALLGLVFPLAGVFQGEGRCRLRDLFGFFSFPCGTAQRRTLTVQSAPCLKKTFRIDAHAGAEDQRMKSASDMERYYMREYAPGDRFRDINWKSSERIDALITRISPDNQEKVCRIEVYFRNFGPGSRPPKTSGSGASSGPSWGDLWLLDRAKARLAQFLRALKEEQASYVFQVRSAQEVWELRGADELEAFLETLAGLPFCPSGNEDAFSLALDSSAGPLYVFSTACDAGLPAFLLARQPKPVFLFFIQPPSGGEARVVERLSLSNFPAQGFFPLPQWPRFRSSRALRPPQLPNSGITIDYAKVGL